MRIAHISDLHFFKISTGLSQFFSKRWVGTLNLIFNRKGDFSSKRLYALLKPLKEKEVAAVIISGDLTTTSLKEEFLIAKQFVDCLQKEKIEVYSIPGNHDHYTKRAFQKRLFYRYFPAEHSKDFPFNLIQHGVTAKRLLPKWWLVLLDTTLATSLTSSGGNFSETTEEALKALLSTIPPTEKILLVNHFPFFQYDKPKRWLRRGHRLEQLIQAHPNIQLYLHGHTHRRCLADLRGNRFPLILDSGSASHRFGSWSLLDLNETRCTVQVFGWQEMEWVETTAQEFRWQNEYELLSASR